MTTIPQDRDATAAPGRRWVHPVAVAATLVVVVGGATGWVAHRHHATGAAPYRDDAVAGRLTLCRDGKAITTGSTVGQPFADLVVGSQTASGRYASVGRAAILFAYQPRAGIEAEAWSGLQLGAPTSYADAAAPAIAPSRDDTTLAQFVNAFPAVDDGWVQLRLVLSAPGVAPNTAAYAAADLHISGTTWTLADAGAATCPPTTPTP